MSDRSRRLELVRVPNSVIGSIHDAIAHERGGLEAAQLLRQAGLAAGEAFYEHFREWLSSAGSIAGEPEDLGVDDFWAQLSAFFQELGWGSMEAEQLHPGAIVLTLHDWAEIHGYGDGSGPAHFTTGVLADLLRRIAGEEVAALEVGAAEREGASCRVLVGSPPVLSIVHERTKVGTHYRAVLAELNAHV